MRECGLSESDTELNDKDDDDDGDSDSKYKVMWNNIYMHFICVPPAFIQVMSKGICM
jgi:hypothetical protein